MGVVRRKILKNQDLDEKQWVSGGNWQIVLNENSLTNSPHHKLLLNELLFFFFVVLISFAFGQLPFCESPDLTVFIVV